MTAISYDLADAAAATGLGEREIRRAISTGDLTAHYGGERHGKILIRHADLEAWVAAMPSTRSKAGAR